VASSWITDILYRRVTGPDGHRQTFLALFVGRDVALLYGNSMNDAQVLPPWLPGLLAAGIVRNGRRSTGRAYNRLLQAKGFTYQRVEGREKVEELRRLMEARIR
jgi:hypothetical protein